MLEISPEKVCFVAIKAREFDVKVPPAEEDPGSNPADDDEIAVIEDYADDPVYEELKSFIDALNEEEKANLVALAWIGRGDFDAGEWDEAVSLARERGNERTAEYLLGMPLLPDYLEDALSELGYSCDEFEIGRL